MAAEQATYQPKGVFRKVKVWKFMAFFFFLGLFFVPFTSFEGITFLGEFNREPGAIFFALMFLVLSVYILAGRRIHLPYKNLLFQVWMLLLGWFLFATILNIGSVSEYYYKQTSGFERFFRQYGSLVISGVLFFVAYYNVFAKYDNDRLFHNIRRVILYSLIVATVYAVLEIMAIKLGIYKARLYLKWFDYFPFTNVVLDNNLGRISSVTFEPPALATYIFSIAGWMFTYIITEKGFKRFIPAFIVIILAFFSGSRAGLLIINIQLLAFLLILARKRRFHRVLILFMLIVLTGIFFVGVFKGKTIVTYFIEKATSITNTEGSHATSNKSRFGIQYALFQVFLDHPLTGVGYGQQTFEAVDKYPKWAYLDNWEFEQKYFNQEDKSFPPGYNVYARLLAESGLIGFLLFVIFQVLIIHTCVVMIRRNDDRLVYVIAIFVTVLGLYFNWLKSDTFRIFGFWINFAFLLKIMGKDKFVLQKKTEAIESRALETDVEPKEDDLN